MVRWIGFLLLGMFATTVNAQIWVDSAGAAVSDGTGGSRDTRGTEVSTSLISPINVSEISVMSAEVSKALQDLANDFGDDGKMVATCSIPSSTFSFHICPNNDPKCTQNANTGLGELRTRWGEGRVTDSGVYKYQTLRYITHISHLNWYGPNWHTTVPSAEKLIPRTSVTIPGITVSVEFSPSGYDIYRDGEKLNSATIGDLSTFKNVQFSNGAKVISSNRVLNQATVFAPAYYQGSRTISVDCNPHTGCKSKTIPARTRYLTNENLGKQQSSRSWKAGIRSNKYSGLPTQLLSIRSMEHLVSAGKFTKEIVMNVEYLKLKHGSNYYTYHHDFYAAGVLLETYANKSWNNTEHGFYNYRPSPGVTYPLHTFATSNRPFITTLHCRLM